MNVVRLLGSCSEKEPLLVILEYVNRGKLQTYLRNSRAERFVRTYIYLHIFRICELLLSLLFLFNILSHTGN